MECRIFWSKKCGKWDLMGGKNVGSGIFWPKNCKKKGLMGNEMWEGHFDQNNSGSGI